MLKCLLHACILLLILCSESCFCVSFSLELSDPLLDDPLSLSEDDDSSSDEELDDSAAAFSAD